MKTKPFIIISLIFIVFSIDGCATLSENNKAEYGSLESAVISSSYVVNGEYGRNIPDDFNADKFMGIVNGKIPDSYYNILKKYPIIVQPKSKYYLLIVMDQGSKNVILFDFSCTPEVDGPVLLSPGKYDTKKIDQYDPCNITH